MNVFMKPILYLIPCTLGETDLNNVLPSANAAVVTSLKYFIVENIRTARRFLKKVDRNINIDELEFFELNGHTPAEVISSFLKPMAEGHSMGVISEAGCPAIADPGADVVALAHRKGVRVVPLVGPSSILMSVMASGLNGQSFAFVGYLPVKEPERIKRLRELERRAKEENQAQLFIEAPYRNIKLFECLIKSVSPKLRLTVATDITSPEEFIRTLTIDEWRKQGVPDMAKRPTIFLLGI